MIYVYLNSFARCFEVFADHGSYVLLVVIVTTNPVVRVGIDLVADVLVQLQHQRVAFLRRQLRVPLADFTILVTDQFLEKLVINNSNT